MSELKLCPFCGSEDIRLSIHRDAGRGKFHHGDDVYSVGCYICGASVPGRYDKDSLIKDWNTRINQPQTGE